MELLRFNSSLTSTSATPRLGRGKSRSCELELEELSELASFGTFLEVRVHERPRSARAPLGLDEREHVSCPPPSICPDTFPFKAWEGGL